MILKILKEVIKFAISVIILVIFIYFCSAVYLLFPVFKDCLITKQSIIEGIENRLVFFDPNRKMYSNPKNDGIPYEEFFIKTFDGEKLHTFFLPSRLNKTSKTLLYIIGNGGNISNWYQYCTEAQKFIPINILIFDHRGYGQSTGYPSVKHAIKDVQTVYDYLIQDGYKPEDISVYGACIGGSLAIELASKNKVKSVAIQTTFTSLRDEAKILYPFIPFNFISDNVLNSKKLIKKIKCPILIVHGTKDIIIPLEHSKELYKLANKPKKLLILQGGDHFDLDKSIDKHFYDALKDLFLN